MVMQTFTIYDMEVFIGQVTEVYANEDCLLNGFPDTKKVNPLFYSMDNSYWTIGKQIGQGFGEGKKLMK
jgi:flavin reductase (DIM6/NTAB) family NADH-FMN oxidoreductase RutF